MAVTKLLVCLANSHKHNGRCVAGIEIASKEWIRPISGRPGHEVSERERQYRGGQEPQVLEVVSVSLARPRSMGFQRENWLLDPGGGWRRVGEIGWRELCLFEQRPKTLWITGYSTSEGVHDFVPAELAGEISDSLKLIRVESVTIKVDPPHSYSGAAAAVRARFLYGGNVYALKVTDPVYKKRFLAMKFGSYSLGESFLTVSLTEEYSGRLYKVVAGIVERTHM